MRLALVLIVLVLDVWALGSLFGSALSGRRKLAWSVAMVFIPLIAAAAWLIRNAGHERSPQSQS
ncbi:MAG: hypothetical protein WEB88_00015 [Gemmatimonadota bacterium]